MRQRTFRLQYNAPVTLTFFFLSFGALILSRFDGGWSRMQLFSVYRSAMNDPLFYIRLFGHVLGHADWNHFIGNMMMFLVVAPLAEERYGSKKLILAIGLTAVVTGGLQCVLFPGTALLGASGVVFMLIMLASLSGMSGGGIPITMLLVAGLYMGQQVYDILFIRDSVANFMHIAGGVCGLVLGFALRREH